MNLFNKNFLDWNLDDLNNFISNNLFENIYFDLKENMI